MNILFTCAGRRNYLIKYFKEITCVQKTVACNSIANTSAMVQADVAYVVPEFYSNNYVDTVLNICNKEKIDILFSLHDLDGLILSRYKDIFENIGVKMFLSDYKFMYKCLDKFEAYKLLKSYNINTPSTFKSHEDFLREHDKSKVYIVKDRFGFGSKNIFISSNIEEILFFYNYINKKYINNYKIRDLLNLENDSQGVIIQEYIVGQEFGLNIVNSYQGKYFGNLQIKKHSMRAGETDSASIQYDTKLDELGSKLGNLTKHRGILDCDVILMNKVYYIIEMNPRFGGQYPFFHEAGSNVPQLLLSVDDELKKCQDRTELIKELTIKVL